jgi:hypothetical protein
MYKDKRDGTRVPSRLSLYMVTRNIEPHTVMDEELLPVS